MHAEAWGRGAVLSIQPPEASCLLDLSPHLHSLPGSRPSRGPSCVFQSIAKDSMLLLCTNPVLKFTCSPFVSQLGDGDGIQLPGVWEEA